MEYPMFFNPMMFPPPFSHPSNTVNNFPKKLSVFDRPIRSNPAGWRPLPTDAFLSKLSPPPASAVNVVFSLSVFTALLEQLYSDTKYDILGYLGGRFFKIPNQNPNEQSTALATTTTTSEQEKPVETVICFVTHFAASERIVTDLINDEVKEVDDAFRLALEKFHGFGVDCVGWYKSNNSINPPLPTHRTLSKSALLQRLYPNAISVLLTVSSSNHPNRLFPNIQPNFSSSPSDIIGPYHTITVYQAFIEERADRKSRPEIYPAVHGGDVTALSRDLLFHNKLRGQKLDWRVLEEGYMNPEIYLETISTLGATLNESHEALNIALVDTATPTPLPAQRMFLESEYDAFLMRFWKTRIMDCSRSIDQDYRVLMSRKLWLKVRMQKKVEELRKAWVDAKIENGENIDDFEDGEFEKVLEKLMKEKMPPDTNFETPEPFVDILTPLFTRGSVNRSSTIKPFMFPRPIPENIQILSRQRQPFEEDNRDDDEQNGKHHEDGNKKKRAAELVVRVESESDVEVASDGDV
ncbi:hypothetical protein HK098_003341 [Nowakowskiella sp. JEL0407]|nr:hypothetical protein HK098_003341 [Nowakowskiella sp. JEL0407]